MRHTHHAAYMQPHIHSYIAHVCAYGAVFNSAPRCAIYSYGPELLAKKLRNVDGIGVEEEEELPGVARPPGVARGACPACWAAGAPEAEIEVKCGARRTARILGSFRGLCFFPMYMVATRHW